MKKQYGRLILAVYPAFKLIMLPIFNYSLMNQIRHGQKIFTSINFYFIISWFVVSIFMFIYIFRNLNLLNKSSTLIGLIISTFFVICSFLPMPLMLTFPNFYQIFIYDFLTTFYLTLSTFSIYFVLFFLSIRDEKKS